MKKMIFYFLCGSSFLFGFLLIKKWRAFLARNLSNQKAFLERNLSNQIKLDIFKCLNFKELTTIQKTNRFLNQFVEDYRKDLVRQNVYSFELVHKLVTKREEYVYIEVNVELVLEDLSLSDELKNKWEYAISEHIPLYLSYNEPCKAVIRINRLDRLLLKLPYYPKNIKEMLIIRSWLKKLSNCIFDDAKFDNIIFNPALIKLLFENGDNLPQFHAKNTLLRYPITLFEDQAMNFVKYHLVVCTEFSVDFTLVTNLEQCNGTILNILKKGNIFPYVKIIFKVAPSFFELIKDHLKTSTNCSNIASKFDFAVDNRNHALNYVNLRNMADETNDCIYSGEYLYNSKFRIVNDNNPNIIFLASYMFRGDNNYTIKFNFKRK